MTPLESEKQPEPLVCLRKASGCKQTRQVYRATALLGPRPWTSRRSSGL